MEPYLALAVALQSAVGELGDGEGVGRQLPQGEGGQRGGKGVCVEVDLRGGWNGGVRVCEGVCGV